MIDSAELAKRLADSAAAAKVNQNCYSKWYDFMQSHGAKPVTDGVQKGSTSRKEAPSPEHLVDRFELF